MANIPPQKRPRPTGVAVLDRSPVGRAALGGALERKPEKRESRIIRFSPASLCHPYARPVGAV
jgi:hypothetical protein